ncbi:type II toxin-antitoxin system ParD family antitoxin [Methylobacterium brachythecii]|uniref:Addiction module antitoxin n=1 Tax=Methylobacterium brachythecii TaxID=1176177 RepID=A0A7W6F6Y4_9HYPH|nr:type II toxin-antitoxin system ParD family antitoxin [Methylobacterium brachythecii]MBB3902917.1 antitoxin ParD1/3/4 [Methylobacterium brachythecii]GLS43843.1 addiction module antitoxin [Methylobacterium brachythecii]
MPSSYTLGDHYEAFVRGLVSSGRYASASEVVRDGLRLMEAREEVRVARLEALRGEIRAGFASGSVEPLDMAEIKAEARAARKPAEPNG